jgi:hypothetical protein
MRTQFRIGTIGSFEGSRLVRGGRYGISIDFSLEVIAWRWSRWAASRCHCAPPWAVASAYDLRPATKEQVQSLGGRFVELPIEAEPEDSWPSRTLGIAS